MSMETTSGDTFTDQRPKDGALDDPLAVARPVWSRVLGALGVLVAVTAVGLALGAASIPPTDVARVVVSHIPGVEMDVTWPAIWDRIVWNIRMPRVLLAGLVGATLAYSGATYQGVLRNPLADPYLIGVAAGAGLGATIAILLPIRLSLFGITSVQVFAFVGSIVAVSVAYRLARIGPMVPNTTLILAGVAISSFASAAMLALMMVTNDDLRTVLSWLMGSLSSSTWNSVWLLLPYSAVIGLIVLAHARVMNVLQLDEEQARHLGINVERVKLTLIAAASLATAAAVSVSGLIGFVGLIVPHMMRLLWGADYRPLLPLTMIYGAVFLIIADLIARTVVSPGELPVGVITAFFGAPFFLFLLRRARTTFL